MPTIMLTGLSDETLALRAMQVGVDLLLAKGYVTRDSLKNAVRSVIDGHMPRRMRILEAEYRYASVAYSARDVEPTVEQLTQFAIVSELQRLASVFRQKEPGGRINSLRMLRTE